jgi:hypothetical protein
MKHATMFLLLTIAVTTRTIPQELSEPWKLVPATTAYELKISQRAVLVSSDALAWSDGRIAMITYWRGGPTDTYYRCIDFEVTDSQSDGHTCWELSPP